MPLGVLYLFAISACQRLPFEIREDYLYLQKENRRESSWRIVWQDEFEASQLDTDKWSKIPPNQADWGNYMTDDPRCYALENGSLSLIGIVNPDTLADPRPFLTGGIWSKGKFAFQYGKVEIRAKLESATGAWPAIWMLAEKNRYGAYPRNGEIDIMEHLNYEKRLFQTTHSYYTLELGFKEDPPHYATTAFDPSQFNTFGLKWYPDKLVFTLNGMETFTYPRAEGVDPSQWPYDQPFYILIDQQLGGGWVGEVNPDDLPVRMIVDWVRVYQ